MDGKEIWQAVKDDVPLGVFIATLIFFIYAWIRGES